MVTVTGKLLSPAGAEPARGSVTLTLVDYDDHAIVGFNVTDSVEILSAATVIPAADGAWSVALTPNSSIQLSGGAAATAYRVTESGGAADGTYWIVVPATGGPYWVGALRTTLVGAAAPSPVTNLAVSGALTVGGTLTLDGTTLAVPPGDSSKFLAGNGQWLTGGGAVSSVNTHVGAVVLNSGDVGAIPATAEGVANGVATLDGSGLLAAAQRPPTRDPYTAMLGLVAQPFPLDANDHDDLGVTAGFLICALIRPGAGLVTNLGMWLSTAGSGVAGVSSMALFSESGTRLGVTGDMTAALTNGANAGTYVEAALASPYTAADATDYYVGVLCQLTTNPKIAGVFGTSSTLHIPMVKGHRPMIVIGGQSSMPATIDVAGATTAGAAYWLVAS